MSTPVFGLDLGNTNCCLSYHQDNGQPSRLVAIEDQPGKPFQLRNVLRSAVLFPFNASRPPMAGRKVLSQDPDKGLRFINFKIDLLHGATHAQVQNGLSKTPQDALVELLRSLKMNAFRSTELGHLFTNSSIMQDDIIPVEPPFINLCAPTQSSQLYFQHLLHALVASGWYADESIAEQRCTIVPEPIAVLLNFPDNNAQNYVVFDYGGLTLDVALAQVQPVATGQGLPYKVLQTRRIQTQIGRQCYDVGGSFLDRCLLQSLLHQMSGGMNEMLTAVSNAYFLHCESADLRALIAMQREVADMPGGSGTARVYQNLLLDVEAARIALSDTDTVPWRLNTTSALGAVPTGISLTEDMLEEVVAPVLQAIYRDVDEMLTQAEVGPDTCRYILAGGCAQTPLIDTSLKRRYGLARVFLPSDFSPLEIIAAGAARAATGLGGSVFEGVTDTDYGVYIEQNDMYHVILERGTPVSRTRLSNDGIPENGQGLFKEYESAGGADTILLKIGQRSPNSGKGYNWQEIGQLRVPYDPERGKFRLYFEIDARNLLRIKMIETKTNFLVPLPVDYIPLTAK